MIRVSGSIAAVAVVLSAMMLSSARADETGDPFGATLETPPTLPGTLRYEETEAVPVTSAVPIRPQSAVLRKASDAATEQPAPMAINPEAYATPQVPPAQQPGYVRLGAPLYPCPRPNIPIWTGSTMITNQAFAPHEMLYPHTYRAIYPPFYHRVKGGWIWTPFGIRSHERWELQGTQVEVQYRTRPPIWIESMWFPPASSNHHAYRY